MTSQRAKIADELRETGKARLPYDARGGVRKTGHPRTLLRSGAEKAGVRVRITDTGDDVLAEVVR